VTGASHVEPVALPSPAGDALLALHATFPDRYPVLLESSASGTPQGRYSILLAAPGERLELRAEHELGGGGAGTRFIAALDDWWQRESLPAGPDHLPFTGGWFLFLGYELAREVEPTLRIPSGASGLVALAWRMRAALILDHVDGQARLALEPGLGDLAAQVVADLAAARLPDDGVGALAVDGQDDDPELYRRACRLAQQHIAAGDVYQVNVARRWQARLQSGTSAAALYARLRRANPAPFAGSAALGDVTVLSSSPERLVRVRGRNVETRPIAGTRPRLEGQDPAMMAELAAHPKERAEHVMLIDLERNDLGRICEPGSVRVDEYMAIESYRHVHHIVSNVVGKLRRQVTPGQVIRALFPGGTITGCPKVRCMQLIGDLEGRPRGAYTGSMGYLGRDGSMDLNILIRTIVMRGREVEFRAGAGVVADSVPDREVEETEAKARGMLRALSGG
jgi:anthranilate synthase component 1